MDSLQEIGDEPYNKETLMQLLALNKNEIKIRCRLCLEIIKDAKMFSLWTQIEDSILAEKLTFVTNVKIDPDENLPTDICQCCCDGLLKTASFKRRVMEVDNLIKTVFNVTYAKTVEKQANSKENNLSLKDAKVLNDNSIKYEDEIENIDTYIDNDLNVYPHQEDIQSSIINKSNTKTKTEITLTKIRKTRTRNKIKHDTPVSPNKETNIMHTHDSDVGMFTCNNCNAGRKKSLAMSPAEKMRRYRERLKLQNPEKFEEQKKKNLERIKSKYKYKAISEMTETEKNMIRNKWRQQKRIRNKKK